MEEILEQIQSLTDKFNNLFEVEGLGEPSGDVPPSTNKLKKDIKTKNGKVELVSVEDELFPKEGNAKEQFKQKVLDKINAMIQGTGTLEDLLNVVRAKQIKPVKEGFEGAIELLEEIIKERYENGYTEAPKGHKHKVGDEVQVYFGAGLDGGKSGKINSLYKNHNGNTWAKGSGADGDFDVPTSYLRTRKVSQDSVKEGFEGAIEVLEELLQCLGESSYTEDTVNKVAKKVRPQREANARKAHASLNHVMNINPYNMINGKLSKKQQELISKALDKANKADDKLAHVNSILNKSKKENKPNGIKFDKILCNYEEAIEMLEGLFVKDGRGDLVDDVVKTITKKPVMKHVQDFTKNLLKPKVKPENK